MHAVRPQIVRSLTLLGLIVLLGSGLLRGVRAAPPASAFGVWDRGSSFDPADHPFLRGLAFNAKWADVEPRPGVFDWKVLDQALELAVRRNQFIYLSLGVGPDAPGWIYAEGVPAVKTENQMHDSWPVYPFYPSPAYRKLFQRLVTQFARHIRGYPKEKQERNVFIQVKTGRPGEERGL